MSPIKTLLTSLAILATGIIYSQSSPEVEKGDKALDNFDFEEALYFFNVAQEASPNDADITRRIANTYRRMGQIAMSAEWYQKTIQLDASIAEDMLFYAEALKNLQQYDEAIYWYEMYDQAKPGDSRAKSHLKDKFYYKDLFADTARYEMKKMAINNNHPMIGVTLFEDEQLLISGVNIAHNKATEESPFLDVYLCKPADNNEVVQPIKLDKKVNSKYHDGPVFYSFSEHKLYITRNNIKNGKPVRDKNGNVNLKIYEAEYQNGTWSAAQELKMNNDDYSTGHACLSKDGQTMYFVSTREGGYGGADIYKCFKTGNSWSEPMNLGSLVNTAGNEMFPYIDDDGKLYLASDGHAGLGGLDIFTSELQNEVWSQPVNMGAPVNSEMDDFALVYESESDKGYFCSNRGGKGDDDLYFYTHINIDRMTITGAIHAIKPEISLAGERIQIKKIESGESTYQSLDEFERFEFTAQSGEKVEITFMNAEYFDTEMAAVEYVVPNVINDPFINLGDRKVELKKVPPHEGRLSNMSTQVLAQAKGIGSSASISSSQVLTKEEQEEQAATQKSMTTLNATSTSFGHDFNDSSELMMKDGLLPTDHYNVKIKHADQLLNSGNYNDAKSAYISASAISPKEAYPKTKIKEIDAIVKKAKDAETRKEFLSRIAQADKHYQDGRNNEALAGYLAAQSLISDDKYCTEQIAITKKALEKENQEKLLSKDEVAAKRHSEFEKAEPVIDLESMEINDVIFDYNKALIRKEDMPRLDKVCQILKENPDTKIMIRAHCDSRGSMAYNQSLSMSRAMAVQGYLIQKGIKRDRMVAEWFGEQRPLNGCIDNVPCNEGEYEINRRAEFKIVAKN